MEGSSSTTKTALRCVKVLGFQVIPKIDRGRNQ
jgi:hypothetical protein